MDEIEKVLDSEETKKNHSENEDEISEKTEILNTESENSEPEKNESELAETDSTGEESVESETSVVEETEIGSSEPVNQEEETIEDDIAEDEAEEEETSEEETSEEETMEVETTDDENIVESEVQSVESKTDKKEISEKELNAFQYDETGEFKWFAVRIISGHENKVKLYLDNQIKIQNYEDKIRNVLIPLEKVFEVKSGKKKIKYKNFLPGYILVEAKLDDKVRSFISQSPSILNMVGSKSIKGKRLDPIPLRESELKRLKSLLDEDAEGEKIDFQLSAGDPVKVISGPFNNFSGNVFEINTEKMKVKVMVSIFGRKTPIELEFTQVEKEK
jgi:transcription termination/antitermination protein NusG